MLPLKTIAQFEKAPDAGYASVYMFDAEAAAAIKEAGNSSGLAQYPVYTNNLTLDLDQGEPQLARVREAIKGLAYRVYDSGGKGFHVVIQLAEMMSGTNVPYTQRKWAEALNVGADLSLYQAGHIISLPGRRHAKTGRQKVLIDTVEGLPLALTLLDPPARTFSISESNQSELEQGLWRLIGLLRQEPGVGSRHVALWSTAKHFADAGLAFDTALDLLTEVNNTWQEPKPDDELNAALKQAYKNIDNP
jgi:hypothetical protein